MHALSMTPYRTPATPPIEYFTKLDFIESRQTPGVFWINITKSEVNLRYRYYSKLFGILRREIEFRYYRCRNSTKSMREKKKKVERENVEFRQR